MSAGTSELFCLMICFLVCSSEAQKIIPAEKIPAELGQNVTLPCKVPNNININNIRAVQWSRPDQDPDYVLFYRDGHLRPENQHPSYQNRVDLQNKDMKDGDFSLILRNVTMEDNGTYECHVFEEGTNDPISIITLEVHLSGDKSGIIGDGGDKGGGNKDGGDKDGGNKDGGNKDGGNKVGIILGSVVGVILLLAVASLGFLIYRRHMKKNPNLPVPTDDPTAIEMTVRESATEPATAFETLREPPAEEQAENVK